MHAAPRSGANTRSPPKSLYSFAVIFTAVQSQIHFFTLAKLGDGKLLWADMSTWLLRDASEEWDEA